MSTLTPPRDLDLDVFNRTCVTVAATTFLLWDTLCTFPDEVRLFWAPRKSAVSYLFFMYRYCAIGDNISLLVVELGSMSAERCEVFNLAHQSFLIVLQTIVSLLLSLRIFGLYRDNWQVILLLAVVVSSCAAGTIWGMVAQRNIQLPLPNCFLASGVEPVASWITLFVFDCLIFSLTLAKTWGMYRRTFRSPEILSLLLHDGAFYFGVMAVANLSNIFSFFFQTGIMRGMFSTPSNNIAVVLMTRLLFNLRRTMYNLETLPARGQSAVAASTAYPQLSTLVYAHASTLVEELGSLHLENDTFDFGAPLSVEVSFPPAKIDEDGDLELSPHTPW